VFKHYLDAEFGAFKETVSRFAKAGGDRISEVGEHAGELLARVYTQYENLHEDFRYSQKSVFKHYLDAEFGAFKETVSRFAKAGGDRISEVGEHASAIRLSLSKNL
jgi:predicted urease superfamily metal-dependent hydrolase